MTDYGVKFTRMRNDIPSKLSSQYYCHVCKKQIASDSTDHFKYDFQGNWVYDFTDYTPSSRYWNGYGSEVFCSIDCSFSWNSSSLSLIS
jgi:hypothetical protein